MHGEICLCCGEKFSVPAHENPNMCLACGEDAEGVLQAIDMAVSEGRILPFPQFEESPLTLKHA